MAFCRNCGHQYEGAANFCPQCGQPQGASSTPEQSFSEEPEKLLWQGEGKDLTNLATSGQLVRRRYRLTTKTLYFDEGLVTTASQQVPLWAVRDIDVKQYLMQKPRGVADVI